MINPSLFFERFQFMSSQSTQQSIVEYSPAPFSAYMLWFIGAFFFAFQFALRLYPGLVIPELTRAYGIQADDIGFMSSLYYYGYAGMQIPMALLLNRFGPKNTIMLCALVCGISSIMFAFSPQWNHVCVARFFLGAASAGGFLGAAKLVEVVFPPQVKAQMIGWTVSIGLVGAIFGGGPIDHLNKVFGWKMLSLSFGVICGIVSLLSFIFLKSHEKKSSEAFPWDGFKKILTSPVILAFGAVNLLLVGPLEGFADAWGPPFLSKVYSPQVAPQFIMAIFTGMIFGAPIIGMISRFMSPMWVLLTCGLGMAGIFSGLCFFYDFLPQEWVYVLMAIVGILSTYQIIVLSEGPRYGPIAVASVALAFLNCLNMLGGSVFHTIMGKVLTAMKPETMIKGCASYTTDSYAKAISIVPVGCLLGCLIIIGLMIARPRPKH
jgi:predicted MFS family arabinose efflux permease